MLVRTALRSTEARIGGEGDNRGSLLAVAFSNEFAHRQNDGLISKIYRVSGTGTPPASGGKIELRNRGRMKYEELN